MAMLGDIHLYFQGKPYQGKAAALAAARRSM